MASPSNLRPKSSCGCEAFQAPRPRRFSHDVAQVSIPIQHARASAWTALRSSRSIVVLLMLFQPEHDVSSWHIASFHCAAEFGRYRGIADINQAARSQFMSTRSQLICPTGCRTFFLSSPLRKNILLHGLAETALLICPSRPAEGRFANVTNVGQGCGGRGG